MILLINFLTTESLSKRDRLFLATSGEGDWRDRARVMILRRRWRPQKASLFHGAIGLCLGYYSLLPKDYLSAWIFESEHHVLFVTLTYFQLRPNPPRELLPTSQ